MHRSRLFGGILVLTVLMFLTGCRSAQDEDPADPQDNENSGGGQTTVLPVEPAEPADWELDPERPSETTVDLEPWISTASGAPEDCIFFASTIGLPQKDAESEWPAERFLATPSVGVFFDRVQEVLLAEALRESGDASPEESTEEDRLIVLIEKLIERPATVYITELAPAPTGREPVLLWKRAGLIVDLGELEEETTASLSDLLETLFDEEIKEIVSADIPGYTFATLNDLPTFACVHGGRLLISFGEGELEQLLTRLDEAIVPEFVGHSLAESDIPKPLTLAHINFETILESPEELETYFLGDEFQEFNFGTTLVGVRDAQSVSHVAGLGSLGLRTKTVLKKSGENEGVIDNVFTEPLTAADFRRVPADAAIVLAVKGDVTGLEEAHREGLRTLYPDNEDFVEASFEEIADQVKRGLFDPIRNQFDVDLVEEILPSLGPAWVIYGTLPNDGPGMIPEFLLYNELNAPETFGSAFDKIATYLCEPPQVRGGPAYSMRRVSGEELLNISFPLEGLPIPFTILTGVLDDCFVAGTSQKSIEAFLSRGADSPTSFADNPFAIEAVSGPNPAAILTYIETASVFELFYPILPTTPTLVRFIQPSLMEYPAMRIWAAVAPSLPPGKDIAEYMTPISYSASRTASGVEVIGYYPTPCGTAGLRRSPVMLPPIKDAAKRMRVANNLEQLGGALQNYHDANDQLPPSHELDASDDPPEPDQDE